MIFTITDVRAVAREFMAFICSFSLPAFRMLRVKNVVVGAAKVEIDVKLSIVADKLEGTKAIFVRQAFSNTICLTALF